MCSATRRQKELELQVLTGPVRNWQGMELSSLGEIVHMGSVAIEPDHRDRYFVLFPQVLLILSVSQRMSAFIYEVNYLDHLVIRGIIQLFTFIVFNFSGQITVDWNNCQSIRRHGNIEKCIRNQWAID